MADDDLGDWDAPDYVAPDLKITTELGEEIVKKLNEEEEEKKAAEAAAAAAQQKQAKDKAKKTQKGKDKLDTEETIPEKALTPQEIEELQRKSDLVAAAEVFGTTVEESTSGESLDRFEPKTKEDFEKLVKILSAKITRYQKSEHYNGFLDDLFRDLCLNLDSEHIRHHSKTLSALGEQRHKDEKEREKAKQSKTKKKPTLISKKIGDLDDIVLADGGNYDYGDDEDFM